MNWINPEIDNFTILSNSDAHSLDNFGREGNVFELKIEKKSFTYKDLEKAIKNRKYQQLGDNLNIIEKDYLDELFNTKSNLELIQTIEFYPQE
jgi:PHP family Zn ribbon phosphoesterase